MTAVIVVVVLIVGAFGFIAFNYGAHKNDPDDLEEQSKILSETRKK